MYDIILVMHTSVHVCTINQVQIMEEILLQILHCVEHSMLENWVVWPTKLFWLLNLYEMTLRMICELIKEGFINMFDISKGLHLHRYVWMWKSCYVIRDMMQLINAHLPLVWRTDNQKNCEVQQVIPFCMYIYSLEELYYVVAC